MIDHVSFPVADFARSRAFYEQALAPLGLAVVMELGNGEGGAGPQAGFGRTSGEGAGKPFFWIRGGGAVTVTGRGHLHVAFASSDRVTVDAVHRAALAAGARDNGPPGLRPHYHPNYYGAFVFDPDGHNIEVVCHASAPVPA